MADFSIDIPVGMDISQVNAALKKFNGDVQQTAKFLTELNQSIKGESRQIGVQFVAKDSLSPVFKAVETSAGKSGKAFAGNERQLKQLTNTYKGSILSLKQGLAARKQELAGLNRTDRKYKHVTQQIEGYQRALNKARGVQQGSIAQLRQQQQKFQQLAETLQLGTAEQIRYANAAKKIENQIKRTTNPLGQFFSVLNRIATVQAGFTAFAALIGTFTGSLNKFIGQQKALEGFELALKNVGLSTEEVSERLDDAARISRELGAPLEQVEKSFKRMVPALEAVGVNASDSGKFLEGIAARTQTLGLNTEQTGRFMEAFAQVLSKGKLQSEELNQQISELDGAFRAQLADSLGVTTQQLEKMIQQGKITSTVFVKAFNDMANGSEELRRKILEGNPTIQQLQNLIAGIDTQNIRRIGKAIEPGIKAIMRIQMAFLEFVETLSQSPVGDFFATVFNEVALGVKDFVVILLEIKKALVFILEPLAALTNQFGGLIRVATVVGLVLAKVAVALALKKVVMTAAIAAGVFTKAASALGTALAFIKGISLKTFFATLIAGLAKVKLALLPLLIKFAPIIALFAGINFAIKFFTDKQKKAKEAAEEAAEANKEQSESLEELEESLDKTSETLDLLSKKIETGFMVKFGDSAEVAANKTLALAAAQQRLNEFNKDNLKTQLEIAKARKTDDNFSDEDKAKLVNRLVKDLADAENAVAKSSNEISNIIQEDLERTLDSISATASGYQKLAQTISKGSGNIANATRGALGDLKKLADAVIQREQQGAGPRKQEQLEQKRVILTAKINQIENTIAETRLRTEFRISQLKNQQIQSELKARAVLAKQAGDFTGAAALEDQIRLQKQIGQEQKTIFDLELSRLDLQKRLKDELVLQQAIDAGMAKRFKNRNVREEQIRKQLGLQKTEVKDIDKLLTNIARKGTKDIIKLDSKAIEAAEKGLQKQKTAVDQIRNRQFELEGISSKINNNTSDLVHNLETVESKMGGVNTEAASFATNMSAAAKEVDKMISKLGTGNSARFMGGPVEGGQTYRVNDAGLGREAFMNKFGDIKMLPAASNMNWTAPSSGTIIPAKLVKAMQKNADINANISAKQTRQTPNISNIASSAASGVSGSLAKQLGSAVSGSTSNRITNNVTIQSQSPVNDASDLMTNVARMRLRNSRRF